MRDEKCEKFFDYASDLSDDEKDEISEHIKEFPECEREFKELQAILAAAREIRDEEPSEEFKNRLAFAIEQEGQKIKRSRKIKIGRFAASALSFAACAALAIGIYSGGLYDKLMKTDDLPLDSAVTQGETPKQETKDTGADIESSVVSEEDTTEVSVHDERTVNIPKSNDKPQRQTAKKQNDAQPNAVVTERAEQKSDKSTEVKEDVESAANNNNVEKTVDSNSADKAVTEDSDPVSDKRKSASGGSAAAKAISGRAAERTESEDGVSAYSVAEDSHETAPITEPISCVVVCDNPSEFAEMLGIYNDGDTIEFTVDVSEWQTIRGCAAEYGAAMEAEFGENTRGKISVTVIAE